MKLTQSLEATLTRRWHQNPRMAHTGDTVGSHSDRVALIICEFWPDASADLLKAAIYHDLAESIVGDLTPAAKELCPQHRIAENAAAVANGWRVALTPQDSLRLAWADKLDALWWADWHGQAIGEDWERSREWLIYAAERMGIRDAMRREVGW